MHLPWANRPTTTTTTAAALDDDSALDDAWGRSSSATTLLLRRPLGAGESGGAPRRTKSARAKALQCLCLLCGLGLFIAYISRSSTGRSLWSDLSAPPLEFRSDANSQKIIQKMTVHAWDGYIKYAQLPNVTENGLAYHDNLDPISCSGVPDLGELAVTLIDGADTLATNGLLSRFQDAVEKISLIKNFHMDRYVSYFEIGIRILGGLISVHLQAVEKLGPAYDGKVLSLAVDIGDRLYHGFSKDTGLGYERVNLATGHADGAFNALAGLASNMLEFGYLTKLTGNPKYYTAAKRTLINVFKKRTALGLYSEFMSADTGNFATHGSHISVNMDSFFEYLIKGYFLFHDDDLYVIFMEAYRAVQREIESAGIHTTVCSTTGRFHVAQVDALEFFWAGLQVLIGDFEPAIRKILVAGQLAARHNFVPECCSASDLSVVNSMGIQRPELAEALYYMSQAFDDVGLRRFSAYIRDKTEKITKTACGYATLGNVDNPKSLQHNQMSFLIAELFKYLHLTFDPSNPVNRIGDNTYVMTTEAHPYKVLVKTRKTHFKKTVDLASELGISQEDLEKKYGMSTRICSYDAWLRASRRLAFAPATTGFKWMNKNFPILVD